MSNYPFQIPSGITLIPDFSGTNNFGSINYPISGIYVGAIFPNTKTITANYVATGLDTNIFTNQSSSIVITLNKQTTGKEYKIISTQTASINTVTISGNGTQIDGGSTKVINGATVGSASILISDGTNYYSLSGLV